MVEYHKKSITMTTLESLQVGKLFYAEYFINFSFFSGMFKHYRRECHFRVSDRGLFCRLQHSSGLPSPHRRLLRSEVESNIVVTKRVSFERDNFIKLFPPQMSSGSLASVHHAPNHPPWLPNCYLLLSSWYLSSASGETLLDRGY